jgi:hypothetical protein
MIATARATEPPNANKASTVEEHDRTRYPCRRRLFSAKPVSSPGGQLDHTPLALLIGIEDLSPDGRKQRHHLMPGDYISDVLA